MAPEAPPVPDRRDFLCAVAGCAAAALGSCVDTSHTRAFRDRFRELSAEEKRALAGELEQRHAEHFGRPVRVGVGDARPGASYAYALDLALCVGCRRCVYACVEENNQSRDPELHWIRVLEMEKSVGIDFEHADPYYEAETVPRPGRFYVPVACQQCENPPCVKSCPVGATWREPDGITVIDYDWCIGCRCCVSACPYGARHFNWSAPGLPADQLNADTHYLGNRPRPRGVVEKCTFCIHRVRAGRYPACVEACPAGARKFGDLAAPDGEIRAVLEREHVFVLKGELNTRPRFFYYFGH
jgi:molybdopterin-containing oxidoreductase family iron-sulfur binding subunit